MANDPPVLIMTSLASGPKHGYALLQDIEGFAGVRLGPGTLDGAINRLEDRGLVEGVGETGRRRPYRLTGAAAEALQRTLDGSRAIVDEGAVRPARHPVAAGAWRERRADERAARAALPAGLAGAPRR